MAFTLAGQYYEIHGIGVPLSNLLEEEGWSDKVVNEAAHAFVVCGVSSALVSPLALSLSQTQQQQLTTLLHEFADIFGRPVALPPARQLDHHIALKEEKPISCRPYRYGPLQKDEIEKQVRSM